jgi:hypothetical protein
MKKKVNKVQFCRNPGWSFSSILLTVLTGLSVAGAILILVKMAQLQSLGCSCTNGTNGLPGMNDSCVCCGLNDPTPFSGGTVLGSAQYVNTALTPGNNNRVNGDAMRFRPNATYNDMPTYVNTFTNGAGTIFNLTKGTYELVYETSITSAGTLAIYNGTATGTMIPRLASLVGSNVANTWLHGSYILQCDSVPCFMMLSPYNNTGSISVATAPSLSSTTGAIIRMSILRLF